jgi:hypothetical protein
MANVIGAVAPAGSTVQLDASPTANTPPAVAMSVEAICL